MSRLSLAAGSGGLKQPSMLIISELAHTAIERSAYSIVARSRSLRLETPSPIASRGECSGVFVATHIRLHRHSRPLTPSLGCPHAPHRYLAIIYALYGAGANGRLGGMFIGDSLSLKR